MRTSERFFFTLSCSFDQRKQTRWYLIWCLPSSHDRSRMTVGPLQPSTWAICSLSGGYLSYIQLNPEFAYHILHLRYRQVLKLSKIRPVNTPLPEQQDITEQQRRSKIKVWREDADTMLSGCPCTQSRTWLFPLQNVFLYRFSFSFEGFPLLGCPKEKEVDMRHCHHRCRPPEYDSEDIMTRQSNRDKMLLNSPNLDVGCSSSSSSSSRQVVYFWTL